MKSVLKILVLMLSFVGFTRALSDQSFESRSFDKRLYSVVSLSHLGTSPKQFASLSVDDRSNLLACRNVLIAIFEAVDRNADASQYLTPELAGKYQGGASLIDPETSLMEVGIFDWSIIEGGHGIELDFLALTFSEGQWILSQNTARLRRMGSEWRVADFRWQKK